jgi:hypothetical protein
MTMPLKMVLGWLSSFRLCTHKRKQSLPVPLGEDLRHHVYAPCGSAQQLVHYADKQGVYVLASSVINRY